MVLAVEIEIQTSNISLEMERYNLLLKLLFHDFVVSVCYLCYAVSVI